MAGRRSEARPRGGRRWLRYYYVFVLLVLIATAAVGYFIWNSLSAETRRTLFNTYLDPDAAARL